MSRTVVIVDDYDGFRDAARKLLASGGYEVVGEAVDAATALTVVERLRPDVVLLDVVLPDGSGFDVAEQLMAGGGGAQVVMVSSVEQPMFKRALATSRARGFVFKADLSAAALDAVLEPWE